MSTQHLILQYRGVYSQMTCSPKRITAYVGPAGTGKTYHLMKNVERVLTERKWAEHERLLALTFMHGSRRRLSAALKDLLRKDIRFRCETIDSFCLRVVQRFRRYLHRDLPIIPSQSNQWVRTQYAWRASFSDIRRAAAQLIQDPIVGNQLRKVYPLVIIDEFQDCSGSLLEVIEALAHQLQLIVAADEFQFLEAGASSCAATEWLTRQRQLGYATVKELQQPRRTNNAQILNTALALRHGQSCASAGIPVLGVESGGLAAWEIFLRIVNDWKTGTIALITPTSPSSSPFVATVLRSLEKELGRKQKLGPYPFIWESTTSESMKELWADIPDAISQNEAVTIEQLVSFHPQHPAIQRAFAAATRLAKLRGSSTIDRTELETLLERHAHAYYVYGSRTPPRRLAMTVHGAKNREFDHVAILWPYQVPSDPLYQRKLLYNAVTRAKTSAVILVQNKDRVNKDPLLQLITG